MTDLATIRIPVDSSDMVKAVQDTRRLEREIKILFGAFQSGAIGSKQFNSGLLQLKREFQGLFNNSQQATSRVRGFAKALKEADVEARKITEQRLEQKLRDQARAFGELVTQVNTYKTANKSASDSAAVFVKVLREQEAQAAKVARANQQAINAQFGITRATKSAADSANVFIQALERQEVQTMRTNAATARSMKGQNQFGLVAQQTGYQVGDFIVQVQSGTNAFVAFGQQATQLAGLLYLIPGAAGAIAGTITSILIPTITAILGYFSRTGEEARTFADIITDISDDVSAFQDIKTSIEESLVIPMNNATAALREYQLARKQVKEEETVSGVRSALGDILAPSLAAQREAERRLNARGRNQLRGQARNEEEARLTLFRQINDTLIEATIGPADQLGTRLVEAVNSLRQMNLLTDEMAESLDILLADTGLLVQAQESQVQAQEAALALAEAQEQAMARLLEARIEERQEQDRLSAAAREALGRYENMRTVSYQLAENTRVAAENWLKMRQFEGTAAGQALGRYGGRGISSGRGILVANPVEIEKENRGVERRIELVQELTEAERQRKQVIESIESSFESGLMAMVEGTKSVKDAFRSMARDIIAELYRVFVVQRITGMISGALGGNLVSGPGFGLFSRANFAPPPRPVASGGSIVPGGTYLVGEKGPEIIRPRHSGTVVPAHLSGTGGSSLTVQNNITVTGSDAANVRMEVAKMIPQITEATKAAVIDARRRGGQMKAAFG
jgi:hypothetical protein